MMSVTTPGDNCLDDTHSGRLRRGERERRFEQLSAVDINSISSRLRPIPLATPSPLLLS